MRFRMQVASGSLLLTMLVFVSLAHSESRSGMEGTITLSPARPGPARIDVPNSAPLANIPFVVRDEKGEVGSFITDDAGRFHISLPPGHYTVARKDKSSGISHFGPFEVEVTAGKITKVEWRCDSGMR